MTKPVTQEWTHELPLMQQAVLLGAIRGPDGMPKYGAVKMLVRWYRRAVLLSSFKGSAIYDPIDTDGGSFYGPSIRAGQDGNFYLLHGTDRRVFTHWGAALSAVLSDYIKDLDAIPHHFQLHLMHAAEIVGYKHPVVGVRSWWFRAYERLAHDMHLWPETLEQLDARLCDTREGWIARADPATVD